MGILFIFLVLLTFVAGVRIPWDRSSGVHYIIGGKNTSITEIPYQVSLYLGTRFICGGSIISPTHVLTAAHCIYDNSMVKTDYNIRAGSSSDSKGGIFIPVKRVACHPKFSLDVPDYDVGIIELPTPLTFTDSIKAIKLTDKPPADGELVKASGWGSIRENGRRSHHLLSVIVPIVNRNICERNYEEYLKITPRMICAGVEGKDACQGDSGGPLSYKNTLVGIISIGVGCAREDFPGIYTNVADPEVRKFIKQYANV